MNYQNIQETKSLKYIFDDIKQKYSQAVLQHVDSVNDTLSIASIENYSRYSVIFIFTDKNIHQNLYVYDLYLEITLKDYNQNIIDDLLYKNPIMININAAYSYLYLSNISLLNNLCFAKTLNKNIIFQDNKIKIPIIGFELLGFVTCSADLITRCKIYFTFNNERQENILQNSKITYKLTKSKSLDCSYNLSSNIYIFTRICNYLTPHNSIDYSILANSEYLFICFDDSSILLDKLIFYLDNKCIKYDSIDSNIKSQIFYNKIIYYIKTPNVNYIMQFKLDFINYNKCNKKKIECIIDCVRKKDLMLYLKKQLIFND